MSCQSCVGRGCGACRRSGAGSEGNHYVTWLQVVSRGLYRVVSRGLHRVVSRGGGVAEREDAEAGVDRGLPALELRLEE
eukprot:3264471-Rhodomonas_salina.1